MGTQPLPGRRDQGQGPWKGQSKEAFSALARCLHHAGSSALGMVALSGGDKLPTPVGDNVYAGRGHSQGVSFGTLGTLFRETGVQWALRKTGYLNMWPPR